MISCSWSVVLLLDEGDPVFLLERDGEAAGVFSKHSPGEVGGEVNSGKGHELPASAIHF